MRPRAAYRVTVIGGAVIFVLCIVALIEGSWLLAGVASAGALIDYRPMRLDHGSLLVSDVERSVRFYTGALGLTEVPRPPTFEAPGAWLAIGADQQLHLVGEGEPGRTRDMNPPWDPVEVAIGYTNHLAFHVDDLDAAVQRAREHGVEPAGEIFARGDGVRRTFVTDPDGHVIELMETGVALTGSEPTLRVPRRSG